MKCDFKEMENEMDLLAANMGSIANFSEQISVTLHVCNQLVVKLISKIFNPILGYQAKINSAVVCAFDVEKAAISLSAAPHFEEKSGRRQLQ